MSGRKAGPSFTGRSRILINRTSDTPDGRRTDIYTIRPDGHSEQRLTDGRGERFAGSYSPHASHIAYVSGGTVGELWTMRDDGTEPHRLGDLTGSCPRYSPDGTQIAFRSGEFGEVWVAAADGTGAQRISGSATEYDQCPSWSPDGHRLAFVRFMGLAAADVWTIGADGSDPVRLTTDHAQKTSAAWSPDGRSIAYDRGGDIWLMAADGTNQRAVTSDPAAESDPVWNTHSTKIAYAKATGATFAVWVLELGKAPYAVGVEGAPTAWRGH
jgi:Tol biopolymer transport system component